MRVPFNLAKNYHEESIAANKTFCRRQNVKDMVAQPAFSL
jgi:hypothetical protein